MRFVYIVCVCERIASASSPSCSLDSRLCPRQLPIYFQSNTLCAQPAPQPVTELHGVPRAELYSCWGPAHDGLFLFFDEPFDICSADACRPLTCVPAPSERRSKKYPVEMNNTLSQLCDVVVPMQSLEVQHGSPYGAVRAAARSRTGSSRFSPQREGPGTRIFGV